MKLGEKIKRYRLINDIRQEDMAESLDISRATLINYEKGHTAINIDVLERLKISFPDFENENNNDNKKPRIIQENIIDFVILFKVLYSNIRIIATTVILSSILGLLFSFLFTKHYSAEISLYPAKKDTMQGLGQIQSLVSNFGMNVPEKNQDFNISDVVKSRLIATKVLNNIWLNLDGEETTLYKLWKMNKPSWFNFSNKENIDSAYIEEKAIKIFSKNVNVVEDRTTGLIKITVTLEDPRISANIANFIGDQVENYIQRENSAQSTKEKLFISDRLSIVKNELQSEEFKLKTFKERNRGYEDSPELFMVFSRIFREAEAKKQVYLTLQNQLELSRIEEVKRSPILHILDYAVQPTGKSSPNRLLFLIIFSIIGLFTSSIITIVKY